MPNELFQLNFSFVKHVSFRVKGTGMPDVIPIFLENLYSADMSAATFMSLKADAAYRFKRTGIMSVAHAPMSEAEVAVFTISAFCMRISP